TMSTSIPRRTGTPPYPTVVTPYPPPPPVTTTLDPTPPPYTTSASTTPDPTTTTTTTTTTETTTTTTSNEPTTTSSSSSWSMSSSTTSSYSTWTTYTTTPYPTVPPDDNDSSPLSTGGIIGISVAAAVAAIALVFASYMVNRRRSRRRRERTNNPVVNTLPPRMQETYRPGGGGGPVGSVGGGNVGGAVTVNGANGYGYERPISQDDMAANGFSSTAGAEERYDRFGIDAGRAAAGMTAASAGMYAYDRQQQLQPQQQQQQAHYSPSSMSQHIAYIPPDEPVYAQQPEQGDMYNHDYLYTHQPQDDLLYRQYQQQQQQQEQYQQQQQQEQEQRQQQLYQQQMRMQQEQEQMDTTAAITGYYPMPVPTMTPATSAGEYHPAATEAYITSHLQSRNPRFSEIEQERHLQQLLHGGQSVYPPAGFSPSNSFSQQAQYPPSPSTLATVPQDTYVDPESNVRYTKNEPWPTPVPVAATATATVTTNISNSGNELSPVTANRATSDSPVVSDVSIGQDMTTQPTRSPALSPITSGKRPHAPQEFPQYKRAPQVLVPETEVQGIGRAGMERLPVNEAAEIANEQEAVEHIAQSYVPPPPSSAPVL
ncbi:hypothetical protein BGZ94_007830, partial [Podila epigama]